jgi:hypothetical protein
MTPFSASFLTLVLMLLVGTPLAAQQPLAGATIPLNVQVNSVLIPVVQELLATSPAFAAQCARIADARHVRVTINPVMASSATSRGTARTAMRRFSTGALIAIVEMPVPLTFIEYAELFGHELEHILEQIDRVDLAALTQAGEGASRLSDGAYETARARRAGLLIADQVARPQAVVVAVATSGARPAAIVADATPAASRSQETASPAPAETPAPSLAASTNTSGAAAAIRQF